MELSPYTVLFQIINFLILVGVLHRFLFKPVMAIIAQRQGQAQMDLDRATQAREQAEQLYRQGEQSLAEASQRVDTLLRDAAQHADGLRAETIVETEARTRRLIDEAEARLLKDQEKARQALQQEVAQLAVTIAAKVLPKALDAEQQRHLLDAAIREVGSDG